MARSREGSRITVGVGGFLLRDERLLVVRKTYGPWIGMWAIPSGYVEPDESIVETIEREVLEETGVRGRAGPLLAVRHLVGRRANDTFLVLQMSDEGGEPRPDGVEVSEAAFMPLEGLVASADSAPFTRAVAARLSGVSGWPIDGYRPPEGRLGDRSYLLYLPAAKVQ
jgi:ADP-ribose pyrophosphatase YjhB (NUDIX family)